MNHIFSHVEVQTFQQEQLLKQSDQRDVKIKELTKDVEELKNNYERQQRRLNTFDEGRTLDLEALSPSPNDNQTLI